MKGRRHGDEIVAALRRLGCVVYSEDEHSYAVARANVRTQVIRKWWIPTPQEESIVTKLGFSMHEYMVAIRANKAASGAEAGGQPPGHSRPDDEDEKDEEE